MIHYVGNEKAAVDFPHGNQKQNKERGYTRTCPSVLRKLEDDCLTGTTSKIYKSAITNIPPSTHMTVLQPRNDKQVENIRTKQLQKHRISHDALYNLQEMDVEMPDFIQFVPTQIWYVSVVSEHNWRNWIGYSSIHHQLSCSHMTPPSSWVTSMSQYCVSDTHCSKKLLSF